MTTRYSGRPMGVDLGDLIVLADLMEKSRDPLETAMYAQPGDWVKVSSEDLERLTRQHRILTGFIRQFEKQRLDQKDEFSDGSEPVEQGVTRGYKQVAHLLRTSLTKGGVTWLKPRSN